MRCSTISFQVLNNLFQLLIELKQGILSRASCEAAKISLCIFYQIFKIKERSNSIHQNYTKLVQEESWVQNGAKLCKNRRLLLPY
jgi:hypothetical protein